MVTVKPKIMQTAFKVLSCNPNQDGKFVWKLQTSKKVTTFGVEKVVTRTYYIGGMPVEVAVDSIIQEDMSKFEIKEYPFANPDTGEVIPLKWLHAK